MTTTSVTMTDRAAARIRKVLGSEPEGSMLRVSVNGGGCSGFQYGFSFDRERQADDLVLENNGAVVLIDPISLPYMEGSVLDFVDDLIGQAFKIENPNATSSCGCGTSFSI
ncbi:iron-sulfur cluster insertion protein ErpA [Terrarubrum flagellatum]|uniref:iron-sulfur cluster insertion protein ErpA n=1 Tax=Terrirubrum flagellatum TaxID=2895980 RepID=UPI0031455CA3